MYVTVRLVADVARAVHHNERTPTSEELASATRELSVTLVPIHPGIEDGELMRYFAIEVPSQPVADRVIERLRRCAAIDAAYVKPPDALP